MFAVQLLFISRFHSWWWAFWQRLNIVIILCINVSVYFCMMFEHAFRTALVINFFHAVLYDLSHWLDQSVLSTIHWTRESHKIVWFGQLSTLPTSSVSKLPCWTTLVSISQTEWKIDTSIHSFTDRYVTSTRPAIVFFTMFVIKCLPKELLHSLSGLQSWGSRIVTW